VRYTVRPISDRTWLRPERRTRSRFTATWRDTLTLLSREVDALKNHIRQDGMLRSDARPSDPAVVVAFESKHGPLLYRSDSFNAPAWGARDVPVWQANVRAVALTLESLRAVDRYGATETGQQYTGFKALPAGRAMPASHMTATEAAAVLERVAIGEMGESRERVVERIQAESAYAREVWHEARKMSHPDHRDGDQTLWDQVEQAAAVLGVTS
jgi:hypothetical protein